jgi:flagellar hook assembly protein FlgD
VHESDDPFFEWDGKDKNGDVLPDGTYFFVASLKHLENEDTQKGTVTILDSKK